MICFSMFDIVNLFLKKTMGGGREGVGGGGGWRRGGGKRHRKPLFIFVV